MDDPKHSFEIQEPLHQIGSSPTWVFDMEENKPTIKNSQSRIKFTIRKRINGCCREEKPHFETPELKVYHRKLKNHHPSSLMAENASYETNFEGSNVKIQRENITCQVCGKIFPSMKSLFGHMRTHPDRQWRGIKPPPSNSSLTVSVSTMGMIDNQQKGSPSTSGRSDFDLLQFLKGWSVTGKRGRLSSDEREAIEGLSMLVNGNSVDLVKRNNINNRTRVAEGSLMAEIENPEQVLESSELQKKRKMERLETGNMEFLCKKPKFDKEDENSRIGLKPGFVELDSGLEILDGFQEFLVENRVVDQLDNAYTLYRIPSRQYISYKSEIMKMFCELGMMNHVESAKSSDRFDYSTCTNSFPSFQSLGGYKSSHIEKAYVDEFSLVDIAVSNLNQANKSQEFNASMPSKKNVGTHQCKICFKTFSSGRALGGHQRHHRYQSGATISPIAILEEPTTMDHKLVEINLNELPYDMPQMVHKEIATSANDSFEIPN